MISLRESINTKKNSFMISDEKNMIPENFLQDIPQGIKTFQTTGIFPGSMTLNYNPVALEDFMHICRTFKIEKISLVDSTPFSSGYENWINGRYELYNSIKKKNTEWMKKYKLIVFLDEKDLYMFKNIYGQNSGNQPELIHYSEFFYRYHWKWNDVRCKNESVYYIPECSMINHLGLKETPLRILEYLAEKVDFPDEKHHCLSGSGIITGLSENIIHKTVNTVLEQISIEKYHQIITTGPLITYLINKILPRNNFTDLLKFIRTSTE
ncbi:MAG: hypothetical protein JXR95_05500 [Deltaproteobacteria bacterium]|nr:hypothetical protein [Deltaproteobacteria bacterium]